MAHDVFVSHSSKDKTVADAICAALEAQRIRCWIAPRDIPPGHRWGAAIIEAINGARAMVLVFTSSANLSDQVMHEVERAVAKAIPIIPLRLEDVAPSQDLELFISASHWLDAITPPLERHLDRLCGTLRGLLEKGPGRSELSGATETAESVAEQYRQAVQFINNGRHADAARLLRRLEEGHLFPLLALADGGGVPIGDAYYHLALATEVNAQGIVRGAGTDLPEVLRLYDLALENNTSMVAEARLNAALVLDLLGRPAKAREYLEQAIEVRPSWYQLHAVLGIVQLALNRPAESITALEHALELNPDDYWALYNLGVASSRTGRKQEAIAAYRGFLDKASADPAFLPHLQGNLRTAREEINRLQYELGHGL